MLEILLASTDDELEQVHRLNSANLKQNLPEEERKTEGFVTWLYPLDLLRRMHQLTPSIIAKDGDKVVAYALATPREAASFHPDLKTLLSYLDTLEYRGRPFREYNYYCMGQICIHKDYRGQKLLPQLYLKHQEIYSSRYSMLVTEISTSNLRSQKAHEKAGFKTIHTYSDAMDEWNVVALEWGEEA